MGRVMHSTADELRRMGHTVDFLFSADVPRRPMGRGDRFVFPIALVRAVRERIRHQGRYDIVEIHEPSAAWYCHLRRSDKTLPPAAVMSHGLEQAQWQLRLRLSKELGQKISLKSRMLVPLTLLSQARYGLRHCQQVMCLNSFDERYLKHVLSLPATQITRVQNGVDDKFFVARNAADDCRKLLFVGSWLEKKGIRLLILAFTELKGRHQGLELSLLGTGVAKEEVLASFPAHLHTSIHVREHVDDAQLLAAYASHNIFLFPTYFEPWGLVLTEAAATGMAIVTTGVCGPGDFFTNGRNALLVQPNDLRAFTEGVDKLILNSELREQLGREAKRHARRFVWRAAAESHLCAYQRTIQNA